MSFSSRREREENKGCSHQRYWLSVLISKVDFYAVCDSRSYLQCAHLASAHMINTTRMYNRTIIVDIGFMWLWLNEEENGHNTHTVTNVHNNVAIKRWKQNRGKKSKYIHIYVSHRRYFQHIDELTMMYTCNDTSTIIQL